MHVARHFSIDPGLLAQTDAYCAAIGLSRSELIALALYAFFARHSTQGAG